MQTPTLAQRLREDINPEDLRTTIDLLAEAAEKINTLELELDQERQDRVQAEKDVCRALGERNDVRAEADGLAALLQPFADFIEKFDAKPLKNSHDEFYGIHAGTEWEAVVRLSDMRAAREALAARKQPPDLAGLLGVETEPTLF